MISTNNFLKAEKSIADKIVKPRFSSSMLTMFSPRLRDLGSFWLVWEKNLSYIIYTFSWGWVCDFRLTIQDWLSLLFKNKNKVSFYIQYLLLVKNVTDTEVVEKLYLLWAHIWLFEHFFWNIGISIGFKCKAFFLTSLSFF